MDARALIAIVIQASSASRSWVYRVGRVKRRIVVIGLTALCLLAAACGADDSQSSPPPTNSRPQELSGRFLSYGDLHTTREETFPADGLFGGPTARWTSPSRAAWATIYGP